jgi:hypothetical protein
MFERATAARDSGIDHAWQGASTQWQAEAWAFLVRYARTHPTVFADDLWAAGLPATRENRALGGLIQRARARHILTPSGLYRVSVKAHAQRHIVWRSLVYVP